MRLVSILVLFFASIAAAPSYAAPPVIVVVVDGLRPDYVTPEIMPRLHALGAEGVFAEKHHAVYPTVTRVNSSTFATGVYPAKHGIMGNTIYIPEADPARPLNTGSAGDLMKVQEAFGGALLTYPTVGEVFAADGKKVIACSAGSSGSAYLLNYKVPDGALFHYGLVLPESLRPRVDEVLGPAPEDATPNAPRNARAIDAYFKIGLPDFAPAVTYFWISDPDHTAHAMGMGDPVMVESLRLADVEIGRLIDGLAERGVEANIMVTSDHGFSTHTGEMNVVGPLIAAGLKRSLSSEDVILAGGAIHVNEGGAERVRQIVETLQRTPGVGAIFTAAGEPGSSLGIVPGTLSFDAIHWNHGRSGQILVDAEWTDGANEHGYKGTTSFPGVAGHGAASPWDIRNTFIASGPAFKKRFRSTTPSGNVDIAAMVYRLAEVKAPADIDGRVLEEVLAGGPEALPAETKTHTAEAAWEGGAYRVTLRESIVAGNRYLDFAESSRTTE